jgi:hypothetical protein
MIRRSFLTSTLGAIAGAVCAPLFGKAVAAKPFASKIGKSELWPADRTTPALKWAITTANRGELVAYVVVDYKAAMSCKDAAMSLCEGAGIACDPTTPFTLKIGDGRIRFVSARSRGGGFRCHWVHVDHAVPERLTPEELSDLHFSLRQCASMGVWIC